MPQQGVYSYDPAAISIVLGGIILDGFADGTFVNITRQADMWMLKTGADGQGSRAKSNNRSATITVTLLQTSATNDKLSALAIADEQSGTGVLPLLVKDSLGTTIAQARTAWVQKIADIEFAREVGDRVWTIVTDALIMFPGGANTLQ